MFTVEVIYATLKEQIIVTVNCNNGDCINDAINASGLLNRYSEINLSLNKVGIFNQLKKLDDALKMNDRVEIYRELTADPKEVRRQRAEKQKEQGIMK